jgi:hypothetical protein
MSVVACTAPTPVATLIAYWLGELDGEREAELEEHLLGCEVCGANLGQLVRLGEGIKRATCAGSSHAVLPASFIRRLQASGVRVREYRLHAGGSVNCTVAPDDDLVVAHLHAAFRDVQRLDLLFDDAASGARWRVENVAFDPAADEVVLVSSTTDLRRLPVTTQRVQLLAVERAGERVIADYTFNHSPYSQLPGSG